jgi:hypothetical protein
VSVGVTGGSVGVAVDVDVAAVADVLVGVAAGVPEVLVGVAGGVPEVLVGVAGGVPEVLVAVAVTVALTVPVGVAVAVTVALTVPVGVPVAVTVPVAAVPVGVPVGVSVGVKSGVFVVVAVAAPVGMLVDVAVTVAVPVPVGVPTVAVSVAVPVLAGVPGVTVTVAVPVPAGDPVGVTVAVAVPLGTPATHAPDVHMLWLVQTSPSSHAKPSLALAHCPVSMSQVSQGPQSSGPSDSHSPLKKLQNSIVHRFWSVSGHAMNSPRQRVAKQVSFSVHGPTPSVQGWPCMAALGMHWPPMHRPHSVEPPAPHGVLFATAVPWQMPLAQVSVVVQGLLSSH